jgi:thiol:disulfide interchange protein DsbD
MIIYKKGSNMNIKILIILFSIAMVNAFSFSDFENSQLDENTLLPLDKAFIPAVSKKNGLWTITFEIAENHYMYQDSTYIDGIDIEFQEKATIRYDENFEKEMKIYYHFMDIDFTTDKSEITIHYQGCAENEICYLPTNKTIQLN